MVLKSSFTAVVLFCATYLAWGAYFSPGALVPGWNLPAIGFGGGGTLGNKQVVSWVRSTQIPHSESLTQSSRGSRWC